MENISMFDMMYPDYKINKPIRLIELFAGVGSQAMALRNIGANFEHYKISEWEVSATASYKAIHMENDNTDYSLEIEIAKLPKILFDYGISTDGKKPMTLKQIERKGEKWQRITYNNLRATNNLGNICNFKGEDLEIVDTDSFTYLLTYSFPCQDLSVAGKKKGMSKGDNTRSGLLWEVERLLNEVENLPQVLLMENVPQVISDANIKDFQLWQKFLEEKGYSNYTEILNAKDYGVAQNRKRCFMVSILGEWNYKFPKLIPLTKTMKDYLEDEVDEKYYINSDKANKLIQQLMESGQLGEQKDNNIPCKLDKPYIDGKFISMTSDELSLRDVGTETAGTITARYYKGIGSNGDNVVITQNMNEVKQIGNYETESTWDNPQTGRVYSADGISPTLNTCGGGDRQPKIIIDDTQGFDGTRIYQDMCPTLRSQRSGLMTVEPALHKIGNIYDSKGQNGNIYSNTGISPAITSGTTENKNNGGIGSSNAPKVIVASRGRNPDNPSDRKQGIELEQRLEPNSEGIRNTLTSVQKDNLVLENCIDFYNHSMRTDKCVGTITTNGNATGSGVFGVIEPTYRIRKLTPKECAKLMKFSDEDANKMLEVNSNTQVYKQCGNSIVVSVLEAIFCQMNIKGCPTWEERAKEEYL